MGAWRLFATEAAAAGRSAGAKSAASISRELGLPGQPLRLTRRASAVCSHHDALPDLVDRLAATRSA